MQYFTSIILAASLVSAAPARRQAANDVRVLINVDRNTESRTNNIPLGELVEANDNGVPDQVFALRIQEDIGATCTFNYLNAGAPKTAQLSFGNDFETQAQSGQVEWVSLLCQAGQNNNNNNGNNKNTGNDNTLLNEIANQGQASGEFRLQVDRDSQGEAIQREFPVGQKISAGDNPFNANKDVFALRLREDNGLNCNFNYLFEGSERRSATFSFGNDFVTKAPSGKVEFIDLTCQ